MLCGECYMVTEVNGEYVANCELPQGCDLTGEVVWDESKVNKDEEKND